MKYRLNLLFFFLYFQPFFVCLQVRTKRADRVIPSWVENWSSFLGLEDTLIMVRIGKELSTLSTADPEISPFDPFDEIRSINAKLTKTRPDRSRILSARVANNCLDFNRFRHTFQIYINYPTLSRFWYFTLEILENDWFPNIYGKSREGG